MRCKIRDICEINKNNFSKKDNFTYINYLDTANITEGKVDEIKHLVIGVDKIPSRAKRKVRKNDIIISTVRPNLKHYGIIRKPIENMIVSTGFTVLSPKQEVNAEYLYWYLSQQKITEYLTAIAETSTTTYPSITANVIADIELVLPEREIQDAIAKILSSLNKKIDLNIEMNKTLEEMAQAIFNRWFVEFEFPDKEGLPYKSNENKFVESELGMIPVGWKVQILDEVAEFQNGFAFYKEGYSESGYKVIDLGNVNIYGHFVETGKDKFVSPELYQLDKMRKYHLNKDDLIIIMTDRTQEMNILGKTAKIPFSNRYILNQRVGRIRSKEWMNPNFLRSTLNSKRVIEGLKQMSQGTAQKYVNTGPIREIKVLVPTVELMARYSQVINPILEKTYENIIENQCVETLLDHLLPKLMSGKIINSESIKEVEECLQKSN